MTYRVLDLFSGIGGFSLGLERTGGFKTVAFCEIEEFPRKVLKKHWPEVPCYDDVRTLTAKRLAADGITVDAICGGFPCQDISLAGKGAGIDGERSGLWSEYARLIGELRPRYVVVENVAALLGRGLDRVLGDLAALGYDAEWHCIPASHVGAPHRRDRLWIVAYPDDASRRRGEKRGACRDRELTLDGEDGHVAYTAGDGWGQGDAHLAGGAAGVSPRSQCGSRDGGRYMADADRQRLEIILNGHPGERAPTIGGCRQWAAEPNVGRVAHGVPSRVDRLKGLGNAVVPQIPELLGRAILAAEAAQ